MSFSSNTNPFRTTPTAVPHSENMDSDSALLPIRSLLLNEEPIEKLTHLNNRVPMGARSAYDQPMGDISVDAPAEGLLLKSVPTRAFSFLVDLPVDEKRSQSHVLEMRVWRNPKPMSNRLADSDHARLQHQKSGTRQ